jgi:hypothetical protein
MYANRLCCSSVGKEEWLRKIESRGKLLSRQAKKFSARQKTAVALAEKMARGEADERDEKELDALLGKLEDGYTEKMVSLDM